jgi:hypothetical protein
MVRFLFEKKKLDDMLSEFTSGWKIESKGFVLSKNPFSIQFETKHPKHLDKHIHDLKKSS